MKSFIKTCSQIVTGATACATLFAGKVMALSIRDGMNLVKTDEMPESISMESGLIRNITGTILALIGALSVVMLVWGGVQYATSAGDAKKVTNAKNTILYALIGLVIVVFSYAIVNFVLGVATNTK